MQLKILWRSMISQSLVEILRKSLLNVKEIDQVRDIKETVVLFVQSMKVSTLAGLFFFLSFVFKKPY